MEMFLMGEAPSIPPQGLNDHTITVHGSPQPWVVPMAFGILNGHGPKDAYNGIGVDVDGDMVLYRKLCHDDWSRHLHLIGVEEIWITIRISPENCS